MEKQNKVDAVLAFAVLREAENIYIPKKLRGKIKIEIKDGKVVVNKKGKTTNN